MNLLISLRAKFAQLYSFNGGGLRAMVDIGKSMQMRGVDLGIGARQLRANVDAYKSNTHNILT